MKIQIFLAFMQLIINTIICLEPGEDPFLTRIEFSKETIVISKETVIITDKTVIIEQPGVFYVTGESEEGNIIISSSSVTLYLENLKLSSKITSPITVNSNFKDVQIVNIKNTELIDLEEKKTTEGECAVIKIKKNSIVYFKNDGTFILSGKCNNIIKGGKQTSLIFKKSDGEYKIKSLKTAIESDGLLEFNGGKFSIDSENGDAIKSLPDDLDSNKFGKILINDGIFNIHCFNDAFTAKNNITIVKGKFEIKTENGYDSETYNETESSKGFKLTNNDTGCEIKIYSGDFKLNTADDAFRSNRDLTIIAGKFIIETKDDAICAKYNLVLGKKNGKLNELNINILHSYEAIEGMTVTIYSGIIIGHAKDDGINASGAIKKEQRNFRRRNNSQENESKINDTENEINNTQKKNNTSKNWTREDSWEFRRRNHTGTPGNDSYYIAIYNAEIFLYTDSDGIDSNGNIYIHGGNINIFSEGRGANEPIDHNGNFTLFNAEILGIGTGGLEFVHEGIKKGNEIYGFYSGNIEKDKKLEIKDENNKIIKEANITKDVNYIFYTSLQLNEKYHFYIKEILGNNETELNITFGMPEKGKDNEDIYYKKDNYSKNLKALFLGTLIIIILF